MTTIFVCGDIINSEKISGLLCSDELAGVISSADYAIGNFEAPVQGAGTPQPKSGIHLQQQIETIHGLKQQGFDLLLLANNHIMDFGEAGLAATIAIAQKEGLEYLGAGFNFATAYKPLVKKINNIKIGMINAGEAQFGVIDHFQGASEAGYAWINHPYIDKLILRLKSECDYVLVFSHAGLENYPIPQKEWRIRYKHFCDLGADLVIGSHPHVAQGYESYQNSLIFYSLGNFYFDHINYRNNENRSFAILLTLSEKNKFIEFTPVFHHTQNGQVQLSPPEKKININDLCAHLEKNYFELHDRMSLESYEKIRQNLLYSLLPIPYTGNIYTSLRRMASIIIKREKIDKTLLQLHLLKNESYYYAARHALEVKARERYSKI